MAKEIPKLRFQGKEYLLVNGDGNRNEGAIATEDEWNSFALNYAHLMEDGRVMRFGSVIGKREDIEWL